MRGGGRRLKGIREVQSLEKGGKEGKEARE
jgi:hypothetical protein